VYGAREKTEHFEIVRIKGFNFYKREKKPTTTNRQILYSCNTATPFPLFTTMLCSK
jgi:hypothetical protein